MDMKENTVTEVTRQFVMVQLGVEQYGINIKYVQNIVRMMTVTRVPKAKKYIKGVVNLRGDIIPVMSIRLKFNLEDDVITNDTRIIFIKVDGNEIGLIVDEVKEVIQLDSTDIDIIKDDSSDSQDSYVWGVGKVGADLVTLLNVENLTSVK